MTQEEALGIFIGLIFTVPGLVLLWKHKKLTSRKYFRFLIILISIMLIGFGAYLGIIVFY